MSVYAESHIQGSFSPQTGICCIVMRQGTFNMEIYQITGKQTEASIIIDNRCIQNHLNRFTSSNWITPASEPRTSYATDEGKVRLGQIHHDKIQEQYDEVLINWQGVWAKNNTKGRWIYEWFTSVKDRYWISIGLDPFFDKVHRGLGDFNKKLHSFKLKDTLSYYVDVENLNRQNT